MSLAQRQTEAIEQFNALTTWYERCNHLIKLANTLPPMPSELISPYTRVGGCQSVTHIAAEVREGRLYLHGKSNAAIPKGIIAFAHSIVNGSTVNEIKTTPLTFHLQTDLMNQLTDSRAGIITKLLERICNAK
jgi:cysteine desulfuration protein SufE